MIASCILFGYTQDLTHLSIYHSLYLAKPNSLYYPPIPPWYPVDHMHYKDVPTLLF